MAFKIGDVTYLWIVREVVYPSEVFGLDDRSIFLEQSLVVTHVVREDFVKVTNHWQTSRTSWLSDGISIDRDSYGSLTCQDVLDRI